MDSTLTREHALDVDHDQQPNLGDNDGDGDGEYLSGVCGTETLTRCTDPLRSPSAPAMLWTVR